MAHRFWKGMVFDMILEKINAPEDIKKVHPADYDQLAFEIRHFLIENISMTGGHLASNLGVVELTMAMHLVFSLPQDKFVWDVGHQAYTHKLLTGRREGFGELRKYGGMSGFPKRKESNTDAFDTGHSSTSISAGLGLAKARDLLHENYSVVSVIGDGALTGGMAFEALNNAEKLKSNFIIILNDNNMSISENTGGVSRHLNKIRSGVRYNRIKKNVERLLLKTPVIGRPIHGILLRGKSIVKQIVLPGAKGMMFENFGVTYLGPVDGHDIKALTEVLKEAKRLKRAVVVHVLTQKGKGYRPAEENPTRFHGVDPFDIETGEPKKKKTSPGYTDVFADNICRLAQKNDKIAAVSAAMPDGTGLSRFAREFPDRFFDVGIAEEHAVTYAAGMAAGGLHPFVAIYSSFLQRAYDQMLHDVCIQNLPVVFAVDRAGLVGSDGETHQGIFDLSFLSSIPNMTVMAPKNADELTAMLEYAAEYEGPIAIRYPRGNAYMGLLDHYAPIVYGKSEMIYEEKQIALLAVGSMVAVGEEVRNALKELGYSVTLVNMRFVKPLDTDVLDKLAARHRLFVTMEENVVSGGFGEKVVRYTEEHALPVSVMTVAIPDMYVEHGNVDILKCEVGIDKDTIVKRVRKYLEENNGDITRDEN